MNKTRIAQLILLLLLIAAAVYIHKEIEDHFIAIICNIGLLLVFWLFRIILNSLKKRSTKSMIRPDNLITAEIISRKEYQDVVVLQLNVPGPNGNYISSYTQRKAEVEEHVNYSKGQSLRIYINPLDQHDIAIPQARPQKVHRDRSGFWSSFITISIILLAVGGPILWGAIDPSKRLFKDITFVEGNDNKGYLWELRFKPDNKIFLKIIDPMNNKTVKKIKEKKEKDLDYYLNFSICKRDSDVIILGLGLTPVFDVYDANTFVKKSGITELEQSNSKFRSGIVKMERESISSKLVSDDVIKIVTTDGITLFYNIQKDLFFESEKEIYTYIEKTNKTLMSEHPGAFVLSKVQGSDYQKQLYRIASPVPKYADELLRLSGDEYFDPERFEKDKRYNCKKCAASLLSEEKFLNGSILYYDTSMVVLASLVSMKKDADEKITAMDKTGKTLFVLNANEYPNIDLMKERSYVPGNSSNLRFTRVKDMMIIKFDEYGALGMDLLSGKVLWKYEQ